MWIKTNWQETHVKVSRILKFSKIEKISKNRKPCTVPGAFTLTFNRNVKAQRTVANYTVYNRE